ncbi:alpha/beta hydrolase [Amycolatopsis mediterranei S699]|uniref:Alpha/beta hydrolase n=2 Tax=Amycolatopsis mediterranei TaxID=33910 RepID=A0A0H3D3B2_AMYMU|nr:alpha/beta fold hydrolase [Amycolatopsis mediterranei]ADJ45455.1 alpha/beta hydrolase [Amycolatopsis mediterranei U32]AEK42224.1 alpha/beta hydrolase [Amycolatopsis mediterranei S699]AFO77167.1 alpha/beta hydrolase [Amycolatopsis mediterranei S699]AGT84295.1 alpha/beta hydrolase [Amycolatopsis mediterranei RB]KDO06035.1 alpha/beta hydrolase [Amycolatopsis mediterranei]
MSDEQPALQFTELPARARQAIASFAPPDALITERLERFADVEPRPADSDGDTEKLDGALFTHRFAELPGDQETVRWHYVETGTGEPVVFLHGMPDSWFMWHHQMAALSDSYRCIAVDLKGYGQSEKGRGDYRQAGAAQQLVELLDAIGVERFTLVTHDRGTVQGDHIAAAHPTRVRHYVRTEQHLHHFHPDLAPHDDFLAEAPWSGLLEDPKRFVVWSYSMVAGLPVADEDMRRVIQEFSYPGITRAVPRYAMSSTFRKEWLQRRRDLIPRWRGPITLLQGWDSRTQPREFFTDAAEYIPHAESVDVRFIPGGHFWPLESPTETTSVLRDVLSRQETDS